MRKGIIIAAACCLLSGLGCQKEIPLVKNVKGNLSLSLVTKAGITRQSVDDNKVNTLEVFIFYDEDGSSRDGKLESYTRLTTEELSLESIELSATLGPKLIHVVANSHHASWANVTDLAQFREVSARLTEENETDFTMIGQATTTVQLENPLPIAVEITRMISRIEITSISTAFEATPFAGKQLSDVSIYLTNVHGQKLFHNGGAPAVPVIYNVEGNDIEDTALFENGFISRSIADPVGEGVSAFSTPAFLYAYANHLQEENDRDKFTRLVVEATLDGVLYYYPVNLPELKGNQWYKIGIRILRPGSASPDIVLEKGSITLTVSATAWEENAPQEIEF